MIKKLSILAIFFYAFSLFQSSFLIYFSILGAVPNFILIFVIILSFFENRRENIGIIAAILAGLSLDIFSSLVFGVNTVALILTVLFIKKARCYLKEINILSFFFIFIFSAFIFNFLLAVFDFILNLSFNLTNVILIEVVYDLILGIVGYIFFKKWNSFLKI